MKLFFQRLGILLLITLLAAEGLLRLQQKMGPLWDLSTERPGLQFNQPSNLLHHMPWPVERYSIRIDGTVLRADTRYDENGVRINRQRPTYPDTMQTPKVLFMGDSFMQGYDDKNTIAQHAWSRLSQEPGATPLTFFEAGCSSYSPVIFIPQAKKLIPLLKPDFIVIDVDETDMGNDFLHYQKFVIRDSSGNIVAVRTSPGIAEMAEHYKRMHAQPSYLVRFWMKLFLSRVTLPKIRKKSRPASSIFPSKDHSPDAREKHAEEIAFFERNLSELSETLISLMGDCRRILYLHHPHRYHLMPDPSGALWNTFVADTLEKVSKKYGIDYYNATSDLRRIFGQNPENFYRQGDMHFNLEGLRIYGLCVAGRLAPKVEKWKGRREPA